VISNTGNVTLTNVTLDDPNAVVSCQDSPYTMAPGDRVVCTAVHTVVQQDVINRSIRNTATATGSDPNMETITASSNEVILPLNNLAPEIICPPPIINVTTDHSCDTLITSGLSATFSDPNGNIASVTWRMTGATLDESPESGINNIDRHIFNLGVTEVTYTVTDEYGLTASCSFTVTISDETPPVAVCQDITVYLDINTGTYTITVDDINNGSTDNCGIASMNIDVTEFDCTDLGPNSVTLTVIDNSGNMSECTSTVTVVYAVTPHPEVIPDNDVICNGETINLDLENNLPVTTWTWTVQTSDYISGASSDLSGTGTSVSQTLFNSDVNAHNVIYSITPRVYGLCDLGEIRAEVWVNPEPVIEVSLPDTVICNGETAEVLLHNPNLSIRGEWVYDLVVNPDPGITGYMAGGRYTNDDDLHESLINNATVLQKVEYRLTPMIIPSDGGPGCTGETQIINIWVHPRLEYDVEISDYNGFNVSCFGKTDGFINITPSEELAPFRFEWRGPSGYSSQNEDITGLSAGEYAMLIIDRNLCPTLDTFRLDQPGRLSMNIDPSISRDGGYNIDCYGGQNGYVNISAVNNVGQTDYLWIDGYIGSNRTGMTAGTYKVILTDANNCQADSTVTLTDPEPIRILFDVSQPFCPDTPDGEIRTAVTGGISAGGYSYLWSDSSTLSVLYYVPQGLYSVTVTDMNGCTASGDVRLNAVNEVCLIIPEAISPNEDGHNEYWNIGNIDLYPDVIITIYNRWGQMIWRSEKGYPHPWDGRSQGIRMPVDGYHYVIDLNNGYKPIIGDVTIVR
jgi:gliding motility-associated-like protein